MRPGDNKLRAGLRMTDIAGRVSALPLARFRQPLRTQTRPTVCHGPFALLTAFFDGIPVILRAVGNAPRSMSNPELTRNNLDNLIGVTDKLRSLVTELKSELQTELIRLRL